MDNRMILTPYFLDKYDPAIAALAGDDWRVVAPDLPDGDQLARMSAIHRALAAEVRAALAAGERPVSIAGDCCATLGVLAGLQGAGQEPALVWLDAHGDFNTPDTTPSGFLGGMPLAMAVGLGDQTLVEGAGLRPWPESKVILSDARDLDPGERDNVARAAIRHVPDLASLLQPGALPDGPLYVHFDVSLRFVSPEILRMPLKIMNEVRDKGLNVRETHDVADVIENADVLYVTRVQKERFSDLAQYDEVKDNYIITPELLERAKQKMIVLHPLPRVGEITPAVDSDPRAAYFRQVQNGMYIRMALLAAVLGKA